MKLTFFSCKEYEQQFLKLYKSDDFECNFLNCLLSKETAHKASGSEVVSIFSRDDASNEVIIELSKNGVKYIATRSSGYNQIDLESAKRHDILVSNVPNYSPEAIAEHAILLMLGLSRKIILANQRIHNNNFSLAGLLGFNLGEMTVGVIGTGKIGEAVIRILNGFGAKVIAYDIEKNMELFERLDFEYVELDFLYRKSDIISLHLPLTPESEYLINSKVLDKFKPGAILINTSRGKHINTRDVLKAIDDNLLGGLGIDVYENEHNLFFEDHSDTVCQDDMFNELKSRDNILITGHQAFFTKTAINNIAKITMENIQSYLHTAMPINQVI